MKIMFAVKTLNHSHGGAERVLTDIASAMATRGHDVSILTFDRPGEEAFYILSPEIRRLDLNVGQTQKTSSAKDMPPRIKAIRKTAGTERPDVIIAFMHSMFIPAAFALKGTGIPLIASEHIVPEHYKTRKLEYALLMATSLLIKKITVVSDAVRKSYPAILHKKMIVIPNPVKMPEDIKQKKNKTILNVGRLDPQKDQETLIRAFAQLATNNPEWSLNIIGEGELRPNLEKLTEELNLQNRIALPGLKKDIGSEYAAASIFAMTSRYEAFGLATAEAMSYGLPAIGFADCPGTNEIIKDGLNGLLIKSDNRVENLAQALRTLIENDDLRQKLGKGGKKSLAPYQLEKIATLWEKLINEVTSKD